MVRNLKTWSSIRVFFPSVVPYLPKKNSKQNPFKQTKKQSEFEYKELKKKERKKNQCQFKIGHLDKLSFEQFFHEHSLSTLIHFAIGQKRQTTT